MKSAINTANIITVCRFFLALFLLLISPLSMLFGVIYLICGLSDIADGYIARTTHTESKFGSKLDSIADILFLAVCAFKLLPLLRLNIFVWVGTALIAALRISEMIVFRTVTLPHSIPNKITGILLFVLPMTLPFINVNYSAAAVCVVATAAAVYDLFGGKNET